MHDVTVSVWNKFWGTHLTAGLVEAGYDVMYLGSARTKPTDVDSRTCWTSGLLTQASFHVPFARDALTGMAIDTFHRFASQHATESRCLWGWSNHHLDAFRKAKKAGIPIILETGSTHLAWSRKALFDEYERHGFQYDNALARKVAPRMLAEYEIADFICVPNAFVSRTYEAHGIASSKLVINAYGMDFPFWSGGSHNGKPDRKFTVVFAGQFMLRKGVAYMVEAWKNAALTNAELWIVGGVFPDARRYLQNLPDNIKVLGSKSPLELREILCAADVFILPSLEEGMARAALEAMAAGVPVIITPETGVGDIIKDGTQGWVIPSRSTEAIIASLRSAAADRDCTRCKGSEAQKVAARYTWKAYGERAGRFLKA